MDRLSSKLVRAVIDVIHQFKEDEGITEPLDGDDVQKLVKVFEIISNYNEGNLSDEEYIQALENA